MACGALAPFVFVRDDFARLAACFWSAGSVCSVWSAPALQRGMLRTKQTSGGWESNQLSYPLATFREVDGTWGPNMFGRQAFWPFSSGDGSKTTSILSVTAGKNRGVSQLQRSAVTPSLLPRTVTQGTPWQSGGPSEYPRLPSRPLQRP